METVGYQETGGNEDMTQHEKVKQMQDTKWPEQTTEWIGEGLT